MAKKDDMKGLGVTFKVGPGQKIMKDSMDGPLYVGPRKKDGAKKDSPKAVRKPVPKPPTKMPKRPVTPTPDRGGKYNPLTNTTVMPGGKVVAGPVGGRSFGDVSPEKEKPAGKRFNPLTSTYYKNGGRIRGDGAARVKTKGRCL